MVDFVERIERIQESYLWYHGDGSDLGRCFNQGLFSYRPLIDFGVLGKLPKEKEVNEWLEFWNTTFVNRASDERYIESTVSLLVEQPEVFFVPYSVFQHEFRSHRLPLSVSSTGTFLCYLNFFANQVFWSGLKARREGDIYRAKRISESLQRIEKKIDELLISTRFVLEGLAAFNDFWVLQKMFQAKKFSEPSKIAYEKMLGIIKKKGIGDPDIRFYEEGFFHSIQIYTKFGLWGPEIAAMFALNPVYEVRNLLDVSQDVLPFNRYLSISEYSFEDRINTNDSKQVLQFIKSEFGWEGWEYSRDYILEKITPKIAKYDVPLKDFIRPTKSGSYHLPPMMLINNNLSNRIEGKDLESYINNFITTIFRKERSFLTNGSITRKNCPVRLISQSCENCKVGNTLMKEIEEIYGIKTMCYL